MTETRVLGGTARGLAIEALVRVEEGAYANLVVPGLLDRSPLRGPDRHFVTELAYGTTRMRRSCDWLLARFLRRPLDSLEPPLRAALRVGAYQLAFLGTPPHAAVSATVSEVPERGRGLVNAVLRRVAEADPQWPDPPTRLSYPDWLVARLAADLGTGPALGALEAMNRPGVVTSRPDGYVQDEASQTVARFLARQPGTTTVDLCAGPGGKATLLAEEAGGLVVGADVRAHRAGLVRANARRLGVAGLVVVQADGGRPPLRPGRWDRVLVDAPCSGLGVLGRRPDARWRVEEADVPRLATLQRRLLSAAVGLLAPGGVVVYSVCTMTAEETVAVDAWLAGAHPGLEVVAPPPPPWEGAGRGARLLPQSAGTDGMFLLALRRPSATTVPGDGSQGEGPHRVGRGGGGDEAEPVGGEPGGGTGG